MYAFWGAASEKEVWGKYPEKTGERVLRMVSVPQPDSRDDSKRKEQFS